MTGTSSEEGVIQVEGQRTDQKTGEEGTKADLFRGSLVQTGLGTGGQGVHPHWGSLHTGRKLTQLGPKRLSSGQH